MEGKILAFIRTDETEAQVMQGYKTEYSIND